MAKNQVCFVNSVEQKLSVIKRIDPYSKWLFITTDKDDEKHFSLIKKALLLGVKIITICVNDFFTLSVDNVCSLFNMPEDVRVVATDDYTLIDTIKYIAKIKNLKAVFILDGLSNGMFVERVFIRNKSNIEFYNADVEKYFMVDKSCVYSSLYECALIYPLCLMDLVMGNALSPNIVDKNYSSFKCSVIELCVALEKNDMDKALSIVLKLENLFSFNPETLYSNSAIIAKMILDSLNKDLFVALIDYSVNFYRSALNGIRKESDTYSVRAKELAFFLKTNPNTTSKWLKDQTSKITCKNENVANVKNEMRVIYKLFSKLLTLYKNNGGVVKKLTYLEKRAVELSGDTAFGVNGASFCRELFFSEYKRV